VSTKAKRPRPAVDALPAQKRRPGLRIWEHWRILDQEARALPPMTWEWRPLVVLITVAVSLTFQEYYGQHEDFSYFFPLHPPDEYYQLKSFAWWVGGRVIGYLIMPLLVIWAMPGERIRDYFLNPAGFIRHLWIYVVLFLFVLPAVFLASRTRGFQETYPFYKYANRSSFDFWAWECMYALQFLSLEVFFRGFLLHGLRELGSRAIFVMVVPYCMIHYEKPLPETLGAIFAGTILGTLAMRTKSIWGGVAIHISVATTMDTLAVHHCPPPGMGPCEGR
jgi:membrane protease YdiL (CAAX protease family)